MSQDFFHSLFSGTENTAQEQQKAAQAQKDQDVQMYQGVLLNPNSDPDQRKRAADKITQLRGLDKKSSPIGQLADFLNNLSQHVKGAKSQGAPPQAQGDAPGTGPGTNTLGAPQAAPPQAPVKEGLAAKSLHGLEKGLGTTLGIVDQIAFGTRPKELPPIDTSVFPTTATATKQKADALADQVDSLMKRGFTRQEALESLGVKVQASTGMLRKGEDVTGAKLPPGSVDLNGDPITDKGGALLQGKPTDIYYPMVGRDGTAVWVPASIRLQKTVYQNRLVWANPITGQVVGPAEDGNNPAVDASGPVNLGTTSTREAQGVDASGNPIAIPLSSSRTPVTGGTPNSLPPLSGGQNPTLKKRPDATSSTPGARKLPGYSTGQFNNMSKGAMGVSEAAAALVGDDPSKPGGLQAHLDVFDNKKDVDSLADYFTAQNQFMEQEASGVSTDGVGAYLAGLPTMLTDLKTSALDSKYNALSQQGKDFVDAFTRAIGTAPGLRSVSSSSSALAALRTIEREYPNPQFVKSKKDAEARMSNLYNEIKQAGSYNPLVREKLRTLPQLGGPPGGMSPAAQKVLQKYNVPVG
jgi:hypothetical protein